jgi:hypothetical protein
VIAATTRARAAGRVVVLALLLSAPAQATPAEAPALFVLPVQGSYRIGSDEARVLEARVLTALARGRRLRPLGPRDLSARVRAQLPADLAGCVDRACLAILGRATGAGRVLALELLDDRGGPVLFATVFDAASGRIVDQHELARPRSGPSTRAWAEEVVRWVGGTPPAGDAGPEDEPRRPPATAPAPVLSLELPAEQEGRPEARALRAGLAAGLGRRWRLSLPGPTGAAAPAAHRAVITVEQLAITSRSHHVHRHRTGALAATLVITDARTGEVLFSQRATAAVSERAHHGSDQQALEELVEGVLSRWLDVLSEMPLERLVNRREKP